MPSRLTGFVCPTVSMVTTGHATGVEKTLLSKADVTSTDEHCPFLTTIYKANMFILKAYIHPQSKPSSIPQLWRYVCLLGELYIPNQHL